MGTGWEIVRWGAVIICWGLWGLVWLAGAIYNAYRAPAVVRRGGISRSGIALVLVAVFAYLLAASLWRPITFHSPWLIVVGVIVLVLSTAWTLWARYILGLLWTSSAIIKTGHELRTDGPYAVTRHPIYTGMLGMLLGSALLSESVGWILYFPAIVVVLELKIIAEERLLTETFGEQYLRYKQRVPQLIPGLRWLREQRTA